ncbi:MAG: hypothetical protein NVSMB47_01100 [Polyangiales bacterium]
MPYGFERVDAKERSLTALVQISSSSTPSISGGSSARTGAYELGARGASGSAGADPLAEALAAGAPSEDAAEDVEPIGAGSGTKLLAEEDAFGNRAGVAGCAVGAHASVSAAPTTAAASTRKNRVRAARSTQRHGLMPPPAYLKCVALRRGSGANHRHRRPLRRGGALSSWSIIAPMHAVMHAVRHAVRRAGIDPARPR